MLEEGSFQTFACDLHLHSKCESVDEITCYSLPQGLTDFNWHITLCDFIKKKITLFIVSSIAFQVFKIILLENSDKEVLDLLLKRKTFWTKSVFEGLQ